MSKDTFRQSRRRFHDKVIGFVPYPQLLDDRYALKVLLICCGARWELKNYSDWITIHSSKR